MKNKKLVGLFLGSMMLFCLSFYSFGLSFSNPIFNEINEIMQNESYLRYDEKSKDVNIYEDISGNGNQTLNYEKINTSGHAYNRLVFEDCGDVETALSVYEVFKAQKTDVIYVETHIFEDQTLNVDIEVAVLYSKEQVQGEKHDVEPKVKTVASRIGQVIIYEYDGGLWSINGMAFNYQMFYGLLSDPEYSELDYDFYIDEDYDAFVADGEAKIIIHLEFPKDLYGSFEIKYDKSNGIIEEIEPYTEIKVTNNNRIFELHYIPKTDEIDATDYMIPISVNVPGEEEGLLWCREDFIELKFTKEDNTYLDQQLSVKIARPPVVFVHGFLGDIDTWKTLDAYLVDNLKYQTMRLEYYSEFDDKQSVMAQAEKLFFDIELLDHAYMNSGIKMNKVDLICHSMGGLIARYLTLEHDLYSDSVRKLIMVGTPNHGCSYVDLNIGRILSYFSDAHQEAAEDLYSGSSLIRTLNSQESSGGHLAPEVEYAIIYGKGIYGGDGIVTESSAVLNGVKSFGLENHLHSDSMDYGFTNSLPESSEVHRIIENLLNTFIERVPLSEQSYEISNTLGDVRIFREGILEETLEEGTKGISFTNGDILMTGKESAALITLKADGKAYGEIYLKKDSELDIINASVNRVDVVIRSGGARFITFRGSEKHFSVEAYSKQNAYTVQRITGLDTDFTVAFSDRNEIVFVLIEGRGMVEVLDFKDNVRKEQFLREDSTVKVIGINFEVTENFDTNNSDNWWIQLESLKKSQVHLIVSNYYKWILTGLGLLLVLFVIFKSSRGLKRKR